MRRLVLFIGLFLFSLNLVSAADCNIQLGPGCSSGAVVPGFWFANDVNSHGSALSVPGYNYVLCCDPINISFYAGTNDVVKISNTRNAHFGILGGASPYSLSLKMTNATCRNSASCVGDEFCLFSLATQTNSHVSECGTPGYNIDICCNSTLGGPAPTFGICGDGTIDTPNNNSFNEQCDGSNLDGENCTSLGWDEGTLSCNPSGSPAECAFNTSGCYNIVTNQPPVAGPNEYQVYSSCSDDGDGDEYGEANWTVYSGDGNPLETGTIVCQLSSEEIPFFGSLSFLMLLSILGGFYIHNYLRRCNHANCY